MGDWRALQLSPFFPVWASATVDEILSALHERIVVGCSRSGRQRQLPPAIFAASPVSFTMCRPVLARSAR